MRKKVLIGGKGGVGKTTLATFFTFWAEENLKGDLLVVDADPNMNLAPFLSLDCKKTLSDILEEIESIKENYLDKRSFLELRLNEILIETDSFDFLAMGYPEREGCYCFVNQLLRDILERLESNYEWCIVDNQAGLEHISRRTNRKADLLIIVAENTSPSIMTAYRIKELVEKLKLDIKEMGVIVNKSEKRLNLPGFSFTESFPFFEEIYRTGNTDFKKLFIENLDIRNGIQKIAERIWKGS